MPPLAIINKSFPASGAGVCIRGYDLGDTGKGVCDGWHFIAQVDQQIAVARRRDVAADRDRCGRVGKRSIEDFVWHETPVAEGPEQVVELLHGGAIRDVNVDGVVQAIGFLGEPAGESLTGIVTRVTEYIEIDFRHD